MTEVDIVRTGTAFNTHVRSAQCPNRTEHVSHQWTPWIEVDTAGIERPVQTASCNGLTARAARRPKAEGGRR